MLLQFVVTILAGWVQRRQQLVLEYILEENRILREQLGKKRLHLTNNQRRRLAVCAKALGRSALQGFACIVTPDTLLRWYHNLVAKKYDGSVARGPGRPPTEADIAKLVVQMATQNSGWGHTRIRGALWNLGHDLGRNTIKRILVDAGLEPAPGRTKKTNWKSFLKAHMGAIAAMDFFTVEVLTLRGLVRYFVLFAIDLKSRRVHIAGVVHEAYGQWMEQVARNLTDPVEGFLRNKRYLIHDRDPLFTPRFARILESGGVESVKLPARSPNLNAYAERFVLSARRECFNKIVPLGEKHLRKIVSEFVGHYHLERNHQGLDNQLIEPISSGASRAGPVNCRQRLGGILNYYYREAA
jgi:transposase InsO family protein